MSALRVTTYFTIHDDREIAEFLEVLKRERKFAIGNGSVNMEFELEED